jgi:hypothetical protein
LSGVKVQVSGPVGAGTGGGSVEAMTLVEGATVGEYVGVSKDSMNGTRKNAPDVIADVGIPFDDTANSPLGRILGPKVILIPDGTPVGNLANPGGPDKFSGFESMDGNMFMVGPCVGFSPLYRMV